MIQKQNVYLITITEKENLCRDQEVVHHIKTIVLAKILLSPHLKFNQ